MPFLDLATTAAPSTTSTMAWLRALQVLLDLDDASVGKVKEDLAKLPHGIPFFVGDADSGLRSINREALRAAIGITMLHAFETALGDVPTATKHVFEEPPKPASGPEAMFKDVLPGNPAGYNKGNFSVEHMVPADLDIARMTLPPCITKDVLQSDPTRPLSAESRSRLGNALAKYLARRGGTLEQSEGGARVRELWARLLVLIASAYPVVPLTQKKGVETPTVVQLAPLVFYRDSSSR
jgi:hypothetical protein